MESANKELKKLDEAKSEFLSIASHQLRTPLTAMKGLSSMILDGDYGKINKKPKEAVSQIFESSERMNELVNNLLNISRIESGRLKFSFEDLDFRELVEETVEELKIVAAEKGVEINLKQPKSKIKGNDKFAVFSVKDNGRGVSKDDQCRLFQKFTPHLLNNKIL